MKIKWFPWSYTAGGVVEGSDGKSVAYLAGRMNDGIADDAGRLIAAAPELYAALEAVRPYFEGEHHPDHPHCRQLQAALTKVRGD